eukprot:m.185255 g.185255  ORF g.185255 m.185255 type:complete len:1467 (-) comp16397_c0_seq1:169-4569(-)
MFGGGGYRPTDASGPNGGGGGAGMGSPAVPPTTLDTAQTKSDVQAMVMHDDHGNFPTHSSIVRRDCNGGRDNMYCSPGPRPRTDVPPKDWQSSVHLRTTAQASRLEKLSDLPPDIVDRYQRKQFLLKLGLFPEISRVWCVVDTDFFLWHAEDYAADFQAVTNIAEVITAVALVQRPSSSGSSSQNSFLLLLATPVAVNVMELEFDPDDSVGGLDNFRDARYKVSLQRGKVEQVPTDNVTMGSITGTPDGRIFMAGSDGAVYELLSGRAAQGWFTSSRTKYRKVNQTTSPWLSLVPAMLASLMEGLSTVTYPPVKKLLTDRSRGILYAWGEDVDHDVLTVYRIAPGGVSFQSQVRLPSKTVAVEVVEGTSYDIAKHEPTRLVVVDNQGGRRVYIDPGHYDGVLNLEPMPGSGASVKRGIGQIQVGQIDSALCVPNLTLMAAKRKNDSHILVALQPHLMQYAQGSTKIHAGRALTAGPNLDLFPGLEEYALLDLTHGGGDTSSVYIWTMEAVPQLRETAQWRQTYSDPPIYGGTNELAVQHRHNHDAHRSVLLLTSAGTYRYHHKLPINDLEALLAHDPYHEDVDCFFSPISLGPRDFDYDIDCSPANPMAAVFLYNLRTRREAVATALALACTDSDQQMAALGAIRDFAGKPRLLRQVGPGTAHYPEFVSCIYDGMCQFLSRLLRSYWSETVCVVEDATSPRDQPTRINPSDNVYGRLQSAGGTNFRYLSRETADNLRDKIRELENFERLIEHFYKVQPGLLAGPNVRQTARPTMAEMQLQQERDIYKLHEYTRLIIEVFHLWLILVTDPNQDLFGCMAQFSTDTKGKSHSEAHLRDAFFVKTSLKDMIPTAKFHRDPMRGPSRMVLDKNDSASPLHAWKLMIQKMREGLAGAARLRESKRLNTVCPTMYSKVDVLWAQAEQQYDDFATATNYSLNFLQTAQRMYTEYFKARAEETPYENWLAADDMHSREGLAYVCDKFAGGILGPTFIEGIVPLVFQCAEFGLHLRQAPGLVATRGYGPLFDPTEYCYSQLQVQLEALERKLDAEPVGSRSYAETDRQRQAFVLQITQLPKSAEVAHWKLFEHYVAKEQFAELVKLPSPFLEAYLLRRKDPSWDPTLALELESWTTLQMFYEVRGRFRDAAELCVGAALNDAIRNRGNELTLSDRRQLLASARTSVDAYLDQISSSMVQPPSSSERAGRWELLPQLESLAEIQYNALETLKAREDRHQHRIAELDRRLLRKEELKRIVVDCALHECILDLLLLGDPNIREGNQVNEECSMIIEDFFRRHGSNMSRIMKEVGRVFRRHRQRNQLTAVVTRLVKQLEEHAFRHKDANLDVRIVLDGLLDAGFPAHELYVHGYKALVDGDDTGESDPIMARYYTVICELCEEWWSPGKDIGNPPHTLPQDIENYVVRVQCIADHWAKNQQIGGPSVSEHEAKQLLERLTDILNRTQQFSYGASYSGYR